MVIDIDMTSAKIPQIIEIIQRLKSMPDEEAMSSWNMGVPYVLACPPSEVEKIVEKAQVR
jgi:phosphoribosylaminoimidazole (AIR) synthetase